MHLFQSKRHCTDTGEEGLQCVPRYFKHFKELVAHIKLTHMLEQQADVTRLLLVDAAPALNL